jgi:hypothetical protein
MSFPHRSFNVRRILTAALCVIVTACEPLPTALHGPSLASTQVASTTPFELLGTTAATSFGSPNTLLRLDPATGGQTLAGQVGTATHAAALAWNPITNRLFSTAKFSGVDVGVIREIDRTTGISVPIDTIRQGGTPVVIGSLAIAPNGTMWGTAGQALGVIDLSTHTFVARLLLPAGYITSAIDFAPSGLLYAVMQQFPVTRQVLVTVDVATPALLDLRDMNSTLNVDDIAYAPDGFIYHTNFSATLFRIDPVTAAVSPVGAGVLGALGGLAAVWTVPVDSDNDGVGDDTDRCPGTPPGATVDTEGCTADQRVRKLTGQVDSLVNAGMLNAGEATALRAKLTAAVRSIGAAHVSAACGQLTAFVNQVAALVSSGRLSPSAGTALQVAATTTKAQMGC